MKNQSHSNLITRPCLVLALAVGLCAPLLAQSNMPMKNRSMMDGKTAVQNPADGSNRGPMMDGKMTEAQQTMMQHHQAMMAEMKTQDAEIATQVAAMNSAPADKKLNMLADIVTRMVAQRKAMNARMGMMQSEMMKCSMQDMSRSASPASKSPAMNGMGMDETTGETTK